MLIANRAEPPRKASPVLDINRTAPASGGATHGPIINADRNPIIAVLAIPFPWALSLIEFILDLPKGRAKGLRLGYSFQLRLFPQN